MPWPPYCANLSPPRPPATVRSPPRVRIVVLDSSFFLLTTRNIARLQGVRVHSVAAGTSTSLAVTTDGEVYGWGRGVNVNDADDDDGDDDDGEEEEVNPVLGLETTEHQLVPLKYSVSVHGAAPACLSMYSCSAATFRLYFSTYAYGCGPGEG